MTLPFAKSQLLRMLHLLGDLAFVISSPVYVYQSFLVYVSLFDHILHFASQVADSFALLERNM